MATHTVIINNTTAKTKHLLGLIRELAKSEENIKMDPSLKPNTDTLQAIEDARKGKLHKARSVKELFESID